VQYQPTGCADICLQIPHWLVVLGSDQWPYRGHSGHLGHLLFDVLVRYALVKHPQRCHSAVAADTNSHHLIGPEFWVKPYKQVWGLEQYSWASALPDLAVCHFALWGFVLPMLLTIAFKYVHTHAHAHARTRTHVHNIHTCASVSGTQYVQSIAIIIIAPNRCCNICVQTASHCFQHSWGSCHSLYGAPCAWHGTPSTRSSGKSIPLQHRLPQACASVK
jgi:hypothetical protein